MSPLDLTKARILIAVDLSFLIVTIVTTIRTIITINRSSSYRSRKFNSVSFLKIVNNSRLSAIEKTQTRYLKTIRIAR